MASGSDRVRDCYGLGVSASNRVGINPYLEGIGIDGIDRELGLVASRSSDRIGVVSTTATANNSSVDRSKDGRRTADPSGGGDIGAINRTWQRVDRNGLRDSSSLTQ